MSKGECSEREITKLVKEEGFNVSRYVVRDIVKKLETPDEANEEQENKKEVNPLDSFEKNIGYRGSLKKVIDQAKAAMLYPPNGLHTLIIGQTGVGKSELANSMYSFAKVNGRIE